MSKEVFEESTLKVRAKLFREGKRDSGTATLIFMRDGVETSRKSLDVRKHWIEESYTLPKVPDDKAFYLFTWRLEHGTGVVGIDEAVRVWPKTCTVKLTFPDGKEAKGIPFKLKFDDRHVADFETNTHGEYACTLTRRATFEVVSSPSNPILKFKPGKEVGRQREAEVSPWKAEIYAPTTPDESPRKQYVNLTPEDFGEGLGHDGVGPEIAFVVGPSGKKDASSRPTGAVTELFVKVTLSDLTKRTKELATLLRASELERVSATEFKAVVPIRGDGCARFVLRLGRGGGEKCEIKVGVTPECADDSRSYINWRKIWVEPAIPAGSVAEVDAAIEALKTVFVEAVKTATTVIDPTPVVGATIPGAELGIAKTDVLIIGDHNESRFRNQIVNAKPGLTAYALFCDLQIDAGRSESVLQQQVTAENADRVTFDGVRCAGWEFRAQTFPGFDANENLVVPRSLHTGNPAASAEWLNSDGNWIAIPPANVKVLPTADNAPGKVQVKYPPALVTKLGRANRSLRVRTAVVSDTFNGWAPNGTTGVVIALRHLNSVRDAEGYQKTVVHEIGHQFRQLKGSVPDGLDRNDHGRYYTGRGHSGGHCADGIAEGTFNGGGRLTGQGSCKCVMYGEGADERPITFCDRCKPFVLAEPLGSLG